MGRHGHQRRNTPLGLLSALNCSGANVLPSTFRAECGSPFRPCDLPRNAAVVPQQGFPKVLKAIIVVTLLDRPGRSLFGGHEVYLFWVWVRRADLRCNLLVRFGILPTDARFDEGLLD